MVPIFTKVADINWTARRARGVVRAPRSCLSSSYLYFNNCVSDMNRDAPCVADSMVAPVVLTMLPRSRAGTNTATFLAMTKFGDQHSL